MKNTAIAERQTHNQRETEKRRLEETRTTADGQKLHVNILAETTVDQHRDRRTKRTIDIYEKNNECHTRTKNKAGGNSDLDLAGAMNEARMSRNEKKTAEAQA
jgi:hypothetical protein